MNQLFKFGTNLGVHVNFSSPGLALEEILQLQQSKGHHYVVFLEGNLLFRSIFDKEVRRVINGASLVYPDGIIVKLLWQLHFRKRFVRVSGPGLTLKMCEYGVRRHLRHFFLGGAEGIAEKLVENMYRKWNNIEIVGTYCPPFREMTEEEDRALVEQIEQAKPDLLWVGLGGPKQEFWMARHLGKINVPVMLGIGAAFDFHSGNKPWAPFWVRKLGLEWLYRATTGGKKTFWRNVRCVTFDILIVFRELFLYMLFMRKRPELEQGIPPESKL